MGSQINVIQEITVTNTNTQDYIKQLEEKVNHQSSTIEELSQTINALEERLCSNSNHVEKLLAQDCFNSLWL